MKKVFTGLICILIFFVVSSYAATTKDQMHGYALNKKYCVSCHDSVADPEKTGFTRDTWHLIINIMHENGLETLTTEENGALVDYFFMIRKGMEREAG
ncbi:hypothetical protein [uncultured Desulfuromusa sp.]|uniref:hypothetical protein n=1 Tax=uncultured Desulfuromusa sp. TaxID=219183 RepID=UPI002AA856D1|nr:hypothetical protein [uncultured Desulfuromusa sp.]